MLRGFWYWVVFYIVRVAMFLYHPVFRVKGRENIPQNGGFLICPNHSGMADPFWVLFALRLNHIPRIMAKKEVMKIPLLGRLLEWFGVFGVDREGVDVNAIKVGMRTLKEGQQLMVFPEGTRVRPGKIIVPKRGAMVLAHRTGSPILPVYLSRRKYPFCPITCVIGEPYYLEFEGKPTDVQMQEEVEALVRRIYEMGENQ